MAENLLRSAFCVLYIYIFYFIYYIRHAMPANTLLVNSCSSPRVGSSINLSPSIGLWLYACKSRLCVQGDATTHDL